jgi:DNA polymerase-3 subunit alpha
MSTPIRQPNEGNAVATPTDPPFVHLKVHSAYSLLEGALPIPRLAKLAAAHAMPAIAITDTNNLFGVLEFSDKLAGAGIQPIAGVSLAVDLAGVGKVEARKAPGGPAARPHHDGLVALYAMNEAGYAAMMKVVSCAHMDAGDTEGPHVPLATLARHSEGLIALTGGPDGPIDRALADGQPDLARARLATLAKLYPGRLYVEMQRHGLAREQAVEADLLALAYELELPIVATNEVYFAEPDDYEAHDALICIAEGRYVSEDDRRRLSREHYLKSAEQMAELFRDLPEALANTLEIAVRCAFRPKGRKPILPSFVKTVPGADEAARLAAEAEELARQARAGLEQRLEVTPLAEGSTREDYEKRLDYELGVITRMKFPGYFLIVADFIQWSKKNGVPVGPGRGSGAGSLVAWALTITDLDPLRFGLLFERFLNPERVSMPDFDIDFCQDKRDRVIRYVQQKYGHDRVAQIITHGKLQARAVLRDVGRVLQMSYGQVDKLCKLVPNNPANPVTLRQAIDGEAKLREARDDDPTVARLLEIAEKLEGLYRHASTHAAGMVIGDRPLDELVPLYRDPKSDMPVTQFNWKLVEAAGLVKFDFLGLKTLTVLEKAVELIEKGRGIRVDLASLPLDDRASYELLAKADTVGVFQLESTGMRESLKRLKPDRFEDIIAMVALYRPGPMDNIPTYINRKHGEEPVDCLHDLLEGILKETYGVIIYQEQVIQIAQVMGGYSLGEADLLRRAMGKKDKAEMARHQSRFIEGATARGVKKDEAKYIFELVDKFAGYGFNKSHAAAYALVSYHTAYLKANYREEFLAASMTLDLANTDKLAMFAGEARRSSIAVLPPCVNASEVDFAVETKDGRRAIRYSLAALKNIGPAAVAGLVGERGRDGRFRDLADFARRLDARAFNKRSLETLAAAGAFGSLETDRALVHGNVEAIVAYSQRHGANKAAGTDDLFAAGPAATGIDLRPQQAWTPIERLQHEFGAIGFYLSGHPLDEYKGVLAKLGATRFLDLEARAERGAGAGRLAGIVVSARERRSQKGNKFAFAQFSDASGQFEAVIFSDTLAACRDLLEPGTAVLIDAEAERDGETVKLRVNAMQSLDKAAAGVARGYRIVLDRRHLQRERAAIQRLKAMLAPLDLAAAGNPTTSTQSGSNGNGGGRRGAIVHLVLEVDDFRASTPEAPGGREMELLLPGRYDITTSVRGTLSTVPGVLDVVEV